MSKIQVFMVLLLVLSLTLVACAPKSAPAPTQTAAPAPQATPTTAPQLSEWDKVLAAARKEGTVSVYNVLGTDLGQAITEGMKQYGIKAENIGGSGGELEQKIMTEQRAKAYFADLFVGGFTNQLNIMQAGFGQQINSLLPALDEKNVWAINPSKYEPTKTVFVLGTSITISVIANTDLVRKGEIQSWQDLLDPKWREKMVMTDPRVGSGPASAGMGVWAILGEDFWKKMGAQRINMQVKYDVVVNQVVYGEKYLGIFPSSSRVIPAINAGAPIQIVHLKEGTSHNVRGMMIVKNSPHSNAALVLLNWLLSKEGQKAMGTAMQISTIRSDLIENWMAIPELRRGTFTFLDPPNNIDLEGSQKGTELAKRAFGAQ